PGRRLPDVSADVEDQPDTVLQDGPHVRKRVTAEVQPFQQTVRGKGSRRLFDVVASPRHEIENPALQVAHCGRHHAVLVNTNSLQPSPPPQVFNLSSVKPRAW